MADTDEEKLKQFMFRYRLEQENAARSSQEHQYSSYVIPPRQPMSWSDITEGLGQGMRNLGVGTLQRTMEMTGNPRVGMLYQAEQRRREQQDLEQSLKGPRSILYGASEGLPVTAGVTAAGMMNPSSVLLGMGLGAVQGGLAPTTSGGEAARNAATGAALTIPMTVAARTITPKVKIEPERIASVEAGRKAGLRSFTGSQMTGKDIVGRAEAHARWNPLTSWHAEPFQNKQANEFVNVFLLESGMPPHMIPKNPAMDPKTLNKAFDIVGQRLDSVFPKGAVWDMSPQAQPNLWQASSKLWASAQMLPKTDRAALLEVNDAILDTLNRNNFQVSAPLVQRLIRIVDNKAGNQALDKGVRDELGKLAAAIEDAVPNRHLLDSARADYAKLMTAVDLMGRSKNAAMGTPDQQKLYRAIESSMPGGAVRGRSQLSDLARGAQVTSGSAALPERSTGWIKPIQDPLNAWTYFRWNNPAAKYFFLNPSQRDVLENLSRYMPGGAIQE